MHAMPINCTTVILQDYLIKMQKERCLCNYKRSISSLAEEEGSSPINCLDTGLLPQSKLIPTANASSWLGKKMDPCHGSPSSQISEPLMGSHGADWSISLQGDFPAKILAWPGKDVAWMANIVASGMRCSASFARYDHRTSLWKTAQCSFLEGWESFSGNWPRWGIMHDGECWELPILEPHISVKGSGLWPTPCKIDQTNLMPWIAKIYEKRQKPHVETISSRNIRGTSNLRAWVTAFPSGGPIAPNSWPPEPRVDRMVDGVANGMERVGALGNGQVPVVAAAAWLILCIGL